ncbi:hypothetical protein Tco_1371609 [Tanacetum coccineum]
MSKPWFASQVDVNKNLSRPVTHHYFPKRRESAFAKPNHMIASRESRNSSKNMPRFSSNGMVHNHYLDEAKKKTQERDRHSKTSVMPFARFQSTVDGSKPKPRSTNHLTSSFLIFKGHRFSPNKTSTMYEKTSPRSDLKWKPTGRIFKNVGLRWIPTGKILASCTSKDDNEPTHGSNVDIPNIYECKQTLDLSAGTSLTGQQKQRTYFEYILESRLNTSEILNPTQCNKAVEQNQKCKMTAAGKHHTEQLEIINEGRVDQYTKNYQVKSSLLNSSPDNKTTEFSNQSLEFENIYLKNTVAQFQKDFSRMEAHCIALELKYQNQALKSRQHGQILNETSNKTKIKNEIDVLETMNIELKHSVAKLLKENETLEKHYKDLYDSIKITRSKTIEHTTSLLANNADLKAHIEEKILAIVSLKNDLRKLKGNSVDTKLAKTSVLGKPVLQSLRNQSVVRQPNAFKSERPQMSKPRFASQVDVNKNLSRPVTQHYLPKRRESAFAKPDHMIASRNSSKNMPRFSSNDMVHNHYLYEAKKKTQERDRISKTSVMPSARFQSTDDGSKPKPRSTDHSTSSFPVSKSSCVTIVVVPIANHSKSSNSLSDSNHFVSSTCHKCVFNENHNACITTFLKEIFKGHRFSPNKTSAVYEKTSPRFDLKWKPTVRIFKTVGLRWIPTGKILASCTSKDDSEPTHGSNVDIPNIHECKQTLDLSADMIVVKSMIELESLFGPLFDEYFNEENQVVSKSSAVTTADASNKHQQQPDSTSSTSTLPTTVTADGNFDM